MKKWILCLPFVLLVLVACAPDVAPESAESVDVAPELTSVPLEVVTEQPPTAVSELPTAVSTEAPPSAPTTIPTTAPTSQPTALPTDEPAAETAVIAGRVDEGAFFLGAPDAPVTMIDYSDFL